MGSHSEGHPGNDQQEPICPSVSPTRDASSLPRGEGTGRLLSDQHRPPSLTAQQKRPGSLPAIERATEGLLGGLVALRDAQWARRPMSETSFIGGPGISRGQFVKVLDALERAGLIERERTQFHREGPVPSGNETRLRLTEAGKALARDHGVAQAHFSEPY